MERTVIGSSNRSVASTDSLSETSSSLSRVAPRQRYSSAVLQPDMEPSSNTASLTRSTSSLLGTRKGPSQLSRRSRSKSEELDKYYEKSSGAPAAPAPAPLATDGAKKISGAQEAALTVMTDFFSKRPLDLMRRAFRDADVDNSGELDVDEFCLAVKNMNTKLTEKDAKCIFALADEDKSGTLGIDEFFINFRHDRWPRERFFWDKAVPRCLFFSIPPRRLFFCPLPSASS